jgi:hypothetical protein
VISVNVDWSVLCTRMVANTAYCPALHGVDAVDTSHVDPAESNRQQPLTMRERCCLQLIAQAPARAALRVLPSD